MVAMVGPDTDLPVSVSATPAPPATDANDPANQPRSAKL